MSNSSYKVYSTIKNIERAVNKELELNDVFRLVNDIWYKKSPYIFKSQCKRIYNEIENSYYDYFDLALYLYYRYIFDNKYLLYDINEKNVLTVRKIFTSEQLEKDKDLLLKIKEQSDVQSVLEFFNILEDGTSIIYQLIKDKTISPYIFIRSFSKENLRKVLTTGNENVILDTGYKQFILIVKQILKLQNN